MLSRALRLATVTLLIGCLTAVAVHAVENLEAGKSPAQIFAGTCNACHKSPRGLLRSVPASSLSGFLRQHYTTSSDMASVLSSYLVSNGATDTRYQPKDVKDGKDAKQGKEAAKESGTRETARAPAEQGAKPPPRLPRAGESPEAMRPDLPVQATVDRGKKDRDKGRKGRPEEPARAEPAAEPVKETTAKTEEGANPAAESKGTESKGAESKGGEPKGSEKTESAKVEPAKESAGESVATRPDPVPAVTPAPATTAAAPATSTPAVAARTGSLPSTPPVQALDTPSAPAGEQPKPAAEPPKPAVASAPALPPLPPAGPPMVPISQ
ncbi:MAG: hypothetical protein U1E61_06640 [Bradyrhizobium sp.]